MVYELGAGKRICAVRSLPDCPGNRIIGAVDARNDLTGYRWKRTLFFQICRAPFFARTSAAKSMACKHSLACSASFQRPRCRSIISSFAFGRVGAVALESFGKNPGRSEERRV